MTKNQRALDTFLKQHPMLRSDLIEVAEDHFCHDVFNANNDKFVGISQVLRKENLTWEECVCFGDSTNDLSMLTHVKNSIAMGNAYPEVLRNTSYVTTPIDRDGIRNALKHFKLI